MKRFIFTSAGSIALAILACADTNDGPNPPQEDAGPPPVEAGIADAADASSPDGDADAGLAMCTDDGWCHVKLPEVRAWGVQPLRVIGLALDGAGSAWAATTAFTVGDGTTTSHVLHYEEGTWKPRFGVGPLSSEPFPYELKAIASNGASDLIAVGGPGSWSGPRGPVVVRIRNGNVTAEYPALPVAFISVVFTTDTEVWAIDSDGVLYRSDVSAPGPMTWTVQTIPYPPNPKPFPPGRPNALVRGTDGSLFVVSKFEGYWDSVINAWVPGYYSVDHRTLVSGTASWSSSTVATDASEIRSGGAVGPSSLWLNAGEYIVGSAARDGGLEWPYLSKKLPPMNAIWGRGPSDVWAVGQVGRMYHYDGTAWSDSALDLNGAPLTIEWLHTITGLPSGEMWAGGQNVVLHKTPGGGR